MTSDTKPCVRCGARPRAGEAYVCDRCAADPKLAQEVEAATRAAGETTDVWAGRRYAVQLFGWRGGWGPQL